MKHAFLKLFLTTLKLSLAYLCRYVCRKRKTSESRVAKWQERINQALDVLSEVIATIISFI